MLQDQVLEYRAHEGERGQLRRTLELMEVTMKATQAAIDRAWTMVGSGEEGEEPDGER